MTHRFPAALAAALFVALATACASPQPVSPLPVDAEAPTATPPPTGPSPTGPSPTGPSPTEPAPTEPAPTEPAPTEPAPTGPAPTGPAPACLGAVRFEIGTQEELQPSSLCFHAGGVLRVTDAGPGEVRAIPASRASSNYAAGVTDVRFVRTGTVRVTYPHAGGTWTVTVVVKS